MRKLRTVRHGQKTPSALPRYPGFIATTDGAHSVVWVEQHISQAACVFPAAPSAAMADAFALEFQRGKQNLWGDPIEYLAAESEHSAASACEGFALAGGRATTFTSGQGLLLMKEVMHSIAGRRLPLVFHLATRSLTSHARTLHCGHDDLMAATDCGWGILVARDPQEAADFALIARRTAETCETPFLCAQDGFITSHSLDTVRLPEPELMLRFAGRPEQRFVPVMQSESAFVSAPLQGPESYMLGRVAQRFFLNKVAATLHDSFTEFGTLTGRHYGAVRSYAMDDADFAFVGMGSVMETAEATVDYMRRSGLRAGAVSICCLRPFPAAELVAALARCSAFTVFERTDVPLAGAGPLASEIQAAFARSRTGSVPDCFHAVCGIGGRDVRPGHFVAAANNMLRDGQRSFVLGVKHPDAVEMAADLDVRPAGSFTLRTHTAGGKGTARTHELLAKIAAELFGLHVHAHGLHGIEKRALPLTWHLTLAPEPVRVHGHGSAAEFVAVDDLHAFENCEPMDGLAEGGVLYIDTPVAAADAWLRLPAEVRFAAARKRIRFATFDTAALCRQFAPAADAATVRAAAFAGVFLRLTRFRELAGLSEEALFAATGALLGGSYRESAAAEEALRRGFTGVAQAECEAPDDSAEPTGKRARVTAAGSRGQGALVPSGFTDWVVGSHLRGRSGEVAADAFAARGLMPAGTAALRSFQGIAPVLPAFDAARCDGCRACVTHCPDAALVGWNIAEDEVEAVLARVVDDTLRGEMRCRFSAPFEGNVFGLFVDPDKCKGCGECVTACGSHGALSMRAKTEFDREHLAEGASFIRGLTSGGECREGCDAGFAGGAESCLGCGESAAVRLLLEQTVRSAGAGKIAVLAAPGCPSDFSTVYPFNPYSVSWANTLAENAAAEALGLRLKWNQAGHAERRVWVLGGYTAMFDSGLAVLSRLFQSGADVKVFVLDTEIYSAVGGTALTDLISGTGRDSGPVQRARLERRKELAQIAMMHPGVFVAQTTPAYLDHFRDVVARANAFAGPALVICYATCAREHGVAPGRASVHARLAVESRAFPLLVFDPTAGDRISDCLSLSGNPSPSADWHATAAGDEFDFTGFARLEPRFREHFAEDGTPDDFICFYQADRLANWRRLRDLAGCAQTPTS